MIESEVTAGHSSGEQRDRSCTALWKADRSDISLSQHGRRGKKEFRLSQRGRDGTPKLSHEPPSQCGGPPHAHLLSEDGANTKFEWVPRPRDAKPWTLLASRPQQRVTHQ